MSTATIGPIDLYYEDLGSGDPLLCIMGFATDSTGWILQTPAFRERYRTIVFDNRGVGRSSKPAGPYTIHQMADDAVGPARRPRHRARARASACRWAA